MSITEREIAYSKISRHLRRQVEVAEKEGYTKKPDHETMTCGCGYSGQPEVIVQHSDWDASESKYDLFICPMCGDA